METWLVRGKGGGGRRGFPAGSLQLGSPQIRLPATFI